MRVGLGYDVHGFVRGRPLVLGGEIIPHEQGLKGHSDADVLVHAVMDALLGAAALGDIGLYFPPGDPAYKDADSLVLLRKVQALLRERNYCLVNLDSVIIAQKPLLSPYLPAMRQGLAAALECPASSVAIKATT